VSIVNDVDSVPHIIYIYIYHSLVLCLNSIADGYLVGSLFSDTSDVKLSLFLINDVCDKCQNVKVGVCCSVIFVIFDGAVILQPAFSSL